MYESGSYLGPHQLPVLPRIIFEHSCARHPILFLISERSNTGKMAKESDATLTIQAVVRRWLIRKHYDKVLEKAAERGRLNRKISKLQRKVAKVKENRRKELHQKGLAGEDAGQIMRQAWEESLLKAEAAGEIEEQPLSETGRKIEALQAEYRQLQVRTKTIEGMMRPLKKNFDGKVEENNEWRKKFTDIDDRIKAVEARNQEYTQRRIAAEKRTQELKNELSGSSPGKYSPNKMSHGSSSHFPRALRQILAILEAECKDARLVEDMQEKIGPIVTDAMMESSLSMSMTDFVPTTPGQSNRRTLQGSFSSGLGLGSPSPTKPVRKGKKPTK